MTIKYRIVRDETGSHVAALIDGKMYSATDRHAGFDKIVSGLESGASEGWLIDQFDASIAVAARFHELSERVTVRAGRLYFDGDVVNNALADLVLRFLDEGVDDWKPLVLFFEKVSQNPNQHSREQLFTWLSRNHFAVTPEGNFIAYKGVTSDGSGVYRSIHAGPAVVNGVAVNGHVPQSIGDVVTMPRASVQHDPSVGCHRGLHVGDWSYASSFGPFTLTVEVNPRDVVSVPTDCEARKMRVCRYVVKGVAQSQFTGSLISDYDPDDDEYAEEGWY